MFILSYIQLTFWHPVADVINLWSTAVIFGNAGDVKVIKSIPINLPVILFFLKVRYQNMVKHFFPSRKFILGTDVRSIDFATKILSLFPCLLRILIEIIFVSSFLLHPLLMRPVSLIWARIIESEKPIFTLIFGGAAAFATAPGKLKDILWPIVVVGGFGAFIDFLIGNAGQARAKEFLLKWWVRVDDVHWMRPISFLWARIVESDKPVFTLTFVGPAAFATAISEAAKHL